MPKCALFLQTNRQTPKTRRLAPASCRCDSGTRTFTRKGWSTEMLMLHAPTVLVLECEPGLREIMAEGLGNYGYQVICALTAKHAAWICRDHGGLIDVL